MRHELTGILTTKVEDNKPAQRYGFMPFTADCAVLLTQRVEDRVAVRAMRVLKYRGSPHVLNEVPFVIGPAGVEVGSSNGVHPEPQPCQRAGLHRNQPAGRNALRLGDEPLDGMKCSSEDAASVRTASIRNRPLSRCGARSRFTVARSRTMSREFSSKPGRE